MISLQTWQTIRHLASIGQSQRQIADTLGVSRKAVRRALERDHPPAYSRASPAAAALEAHREHVAARLRHGLCGVRLLEEVRARGYQGSRSVFYRWLASVRRSLAAPEGCCRFETGPAEQAQFDWSPYTLSIGGRLLPVLVYSLLLGYSRRVHWFPSLSERQDSILEGMEAGWRHFGGCCRFVLIDNARSMVLRHRRSEVRWNDTFLAFCGHYRVEPIAATPGHPQTKGKVENPFLHLERRFLTGSAWRDWSHFEEELARFEARWEERVHQTTKETPRTRFAAEREHLLPLPKDIFLGARTHLRRVNNDGLFSFGGVRYCTPGAAGGSVRVRTHQGRDLLVFSLEGEELIRHSLAPSGSPPVLLPACYQASKRRQHTALAALLCAFHHRFHEYPQVVRAYLDLLLRRHPNRPEQTLARVLELLEPVHAALAVATLAQLVEAGLPEPRFLQVLLARKLRGAEEPAAPPPSAQPLLPELAVERSLCAYADLLGPDPDTKGDR